MQKKLWKTVAGAAILLALAFGGCGFDLPQDTGPEGAVDPTLSPPPAGKAWVKIPAPGLANSAARTLDGANSSRYVDYYEVFFVTRASTGNNAPDAGSIVMGKAGLGETLAVAVYPDEAYSVLLLAGQKQTKMLLASSYKDSFTIVPGQINTLDLPLQYVTSNPVDNDFTYNGYLPLPQTGDPSDSTAYKPVTGTAFTQLKSIAIDNGGTGFQPGNLIAIEFDDTSTEDLKPVVRVTEVEGNVIKAVVIENPGRLAGADAPEDVAALTLLPVGANGDLDDVTFKDIVFEPIAVNHIPAGVPWLAYVGGRSATGVQQPLIFNVTTKGLDPLLDAGGSTGKGATNVQLYRTELWIQPVGENTKFQPLHKLKLKNLPLDAGPVEGTDYTVTAPSGTAGTGAITAKYKLVAPANFPPADQPGWGALFSRIDYRAFGLDKGSIWTIRSGFNLTEVDKGTANKGAAILVRIGNPSKYGGGDKLEVSINSF
jgi:hypothetical protein